MKDEEQIQAIASKLKEVDIILDEELFKKNLSLLSKSSDLILLRDRIKTLTEVITSSKDDYDAKRDAYRLLTQISKLETLIYLTDDIDNFKSIVKPESSRYDKVSSCLKAALVGASHIAESLFGDCNPKENTYLISYAICSGKNDWVKQLVEKFEIDISLNKYCFLIYTQRLQNEELKVYYQQHLQLKKSALNLTVTTVPQSKFFPTEKVDIPPVLLGIFEDGLLGIWETLQEFSITDQKLILAILRNNELSPEQATYLIRQIEQDNGLPEILSSSFDILFCSFHLKKWEKLVNNQHKKSFIDNTANIALSDKASMEAKERAILKLKIYAYKYVHNLLDQISNEHTNLTEAESNRKASLFSSLNSQKIEESSSSNSPRMHNKSFIDDYLEEFQPYYDNLISQNLVISESSKNSLSFDLKLDNDSWKNLSKNTSVWNNIFNLIKYPPINKKERNEEKMLAVIKAMLYKEATQCKWGDLPQWAPPVGQVYYYYREWTRMNLLKEIFTLSYENSKASNTSKTIFTKT